MNKEGLISVPFWLRNQNYGDEWLLAEIDVASTSDYKVAFEGHIVRSGWFGYVALDDVKIQNRKCPPPGFCDFESLPRLCTWKNIEGRDNIS